MIPTNIRWIMGGIAASLACVAVLGGFQPIVRNLIGLMAVWFAARAILNLR